MRRSFSMALVHAFSCSPFSAVSTYFVAVFHPALSAWSPFRVLLCCRQSFPLLESSKTPAHQRIRMAIALINIWFWGRGGAKRSILFGVRSGLLVPSILCLSIGLMLRVAALWTAGSNFTHLIQTKRHEGHQLVQQGAYNYVRHPSYLG
ncbi:unnamed protein product [Amoebophrya sp. A25]|nr:unnamed protein product [Amoebophrya sp. A25]|eukprot:GSA25T00021363001.1